MDPNAIEQGIRERVAQLAEDSSQAEIARRTGTTRNNVSRYLRGTRIPAEFAGALVEGMGVNPSWLLTGEGSRYLADMAEDTSRTAGDLLAMIKAMNAVARMKLGALVGKHHLRVLRELNDALRETEKVRARLNEDLLPVFSDLLDQYKLAISKHALDHADDLRQALLQTSKLCDDRRLGMIFLHLQSAHEMMLGNPDAALEFERRVFQQRVTIAGELLTDQACNHVRNMMQLMVLNDRDREAAAVGRSILALADAANIDAAWIRLIECEVGTAEVTCGDIRRGLPRFTVAFANLPPERRQTQEPSMAYNQYLAGTLSAEDIMGMRTGHEHNARLALYAVLMREDAGLLKRALDEFTGAEGYRLPRRKSLVQHAERLLKVLQGGDASPPKSYPEDEFSEHADIYGAQLQRLRGRKQSARKLVRKVYESYLARPPELSINNFFYAVHCRNALQTIPDDTRAPKLAEARQQAADWVRGRLKDGYGFLYPLRELVQVDVVDTMEVLWTQ